MAENKVRIEDHAGNIYYPHTMADVVFDPTTGKTTQQLLSEKVEKVTGKQLSTNDYTTAEKNKLTGIAAGAQVNAVTSVAGKTGAVTLTKADVGLGSVVDYGIATQAEAEAGTATNKYMTSQRTKQAVDKGLAPLQDQVNTHLAHMTWYEATLVNGHTGTIKYAKNTHGTVFVLIAINKVPVILPHQKLCTLPVGFRPNHQMPIAVNQTNLTPYGNNMPFFINGSGEILIADDNNLNAATVSSDALGLRGGISYYASY